MKSIDPVEPEKTIGQIESELAQRIDNVLRELNLLPEGYTHQVRLHGKKKDKKRTASAANWSPDSDSIRISFEPAQESSSTTSQVLAASAKIEPSSPAANDPISNLLHALDKAETRRGFDFVALKWFRDVALVNEGYDWATSDSTRQNVLRQAIERRFILTSKVPNPKSPQFPVTAIRLNRLLPEVKTILGIEGHYSSDFAPVDIRGGSLSGTILRERR